MRLYFFLALFSVSLLTKAQQISVKDRETGQPIFNVAVFNKDKSKSTLTDFDGKADITQFSPSEIIFFRHVSHLEEHFTKKQITRQEGIVWMEQSENQLQEVVVSVSGFDQRKAELPHEIISINRKDIITASPQTSADLLESTGRVFVQKSQLGGGSPMIRGFATNRLLLTVDGVRMNTAIFRGGNLQNVISIDPLAVEKVEVVLGPGAVIYGSDAIGGVMNFYTLSPEFSSRKGGDFSGKAYTRYATANEEKTGHLDVSYGSEKWAFLSSASFSDFGDMRMGSYGPEEYLRPEYVVQRDGLDVTVQNDDPKVQVPTGYDQINLLEKVRYRPTQDWEFGLGVNYSTTSDYPRYDRLYRKKNGQLRAAEWYYGPQEWLQANFQIDKAGKGMLYDDAKFTAAYQFFEESRHDRDYNKVILYETEENVDAWSGNLDFEKDFFGSKLFYGLEYVYNKVHSGGTETDISTGEKVVGTSRYPDGATWQSMAAYSSLQWKPARDLTVQAGMRYNRILLQATFSEDIYDFPFSDADLNTGALTGNVGMNWKQNDIFGWQLNLSSAFRAPNVDDVGKIFDSTPGMVVVPNPDLQPETAYNAEVGSFITIENLLKLDIAVYYTYLDNALVRGDFSLNGQTEIEYQGEPSRVEAIQNAASAKVYGIEAGADLRLSKDLKFTSQFSYTNGEEEQDDGSTAPLRHAAPLFGNAHLVFENNAWRLDFFAEYNGEISYEELAPSEKSKDYLYAIDANGNPYSPEWYTLNLTSQYEIGKGWLAKASLENITDQRYRTYSSGIAAAGRNLILSLQYSF
ncbi:TonB-dependent receptor [Salinimicrobium soli]|uniref:TonB-dependent receptor n=1 Tax=Salinimicrobium soli TaxID=1254399 RepID=UPI003AABCE64